MRPNQSTNGVTNPKALQMYLQQARTFESQNRWEDAAREYLKAIELGMQAAWVYFKLGAIRYLQRRYDEAIVHYKQGLALEPDNASAYADLSKLYEKEGRWDESLYFLDRALELKPTLPKAKRRQKRVLEQREKYRQRGEELQNWRLPDVNGEDVSPTWNDFDTLNFGPFFVKFRVATEGEFVRTIHKILMKGYREIGSDLGYYPAKVSVVVYSDKSEYVQACAEANIGVPRWSVGVYDGHTIRIQARNMGKTTSACPTEYVGLLCENLLHEYVHLVVDHLTDGRYPAWLNEGLAEYEAKELLKWQREQLSQLMKGRRHIPLKQLEQGFGILPEDQSRLAYLQSYSVVEFIVERFGMDKVRQLLSSLGQGTSIDEALLQTLCIGYNSLESQWLQEFCS